MEELERSGKRLFAVALAVLVLISVPLTRNKNTTGKLDSKTSDEKTSMPTLSGENAIRHLKQNGQYEFLGEAVIAARYAANSLKDTASVMNHANQMRATFSSDGLSLESTAKNAEWQTRWRLHDVAHGDDQFIIGESDVQTSGNRITIMRRLIENDESKIQNPKSKIVEEWFNNTPNGLEHGFTLPERLSDGAENLRLTIAIEGDLSVQVVADGQTLWLVNGRGEPILSYDKLRVWDANGAEIAARMKTGNGAVTLEVDDAAAKYPLTIDPTFSASGKLVASDGAARDNFGYSVAISGDTVIVGSPADDNPPGGEDGGSAYIFVRNAGVWTQQAKIAFGLAGDRVGHSVAISGDTAVVGVILDDFGGNPDQGSAIVYVRNGSNWSQQQILFADDGETNDSFSESVDISGNTIIVGADGDDIGGNTDQGSAYIFVRSGTTWTKQQKLTATGGGAGDNFGLSVAIADPTVVIGAGLADIGPSGINQGSAYIFTRSGTTWTQRHEFLAPDGEVGDEFGVSVDISSGFMSSTVVIGSSGDDIGDVNAQGSVFVFTGSGATWTQQQKLTASDGAASDFLGRTVAISAGTIVASSGFDDVGSNGSQGTTYIFTRSGGTTWNERQHLPAFDGAAGDLFGHSVAISGDTIVCGAASDDFVGNADQGSAYVFQLASKPFDFDDDGKTDVGIFRPNVGEWWIYPSSTGSTVALQFGASTDKIVPADYTGDGKTDVALWRPSTGQWFIVRSEDGSFYAGPFGTTGDIPVPADYDADGKADVAVFRPSNGNWYVQRSSDNQTAVQLFGQNGDRPIVGDYDGDGKADVAIFRPSVGQWWINRTTAGTIAYGLGNSTDKIVPGDYTGDGKTDVAFWRPSTVEWFILRSEDTTYYSAPFGVATDIPAPGDYDGDGKFDVTVFRPSTGTWFVNRTSGGSSAQQFGATGDQPVGSAFVR